MKIVNKTAVLTAFRDGYPLYRIPGIAATAKGTLILSYEARKTLASRGMGDWSVIDLYIRRSEDGGKTWGECIRMLNGAGKNTTNNPVIIPDGETLHFIGMENYKRAFVRTSVDDGITWSEPREITDAFEEVRESYNWTVIAAGPGHGMRMSNGRLVVPVWYASNPACIYEHNPSACGTIYSDDHGLTWHAGDVINPDFMIDPNESAVAELSDGSLMINMRSQRPGREFAEHRGIPEGDHYRAVGISANGYSDWQDVRYDSSLRDPVCAAGMCNAPQGILYTGCDSVRSRTYLTLRLSKDDCKSWCDSIMYETLGGYSDCCYNAVTGTAFTAYETDDYAHICVCEIEL